MRLTRISPIVLCVTCGACGQQRLPAPAVALEACAVRNVATVDSLWHHVRGAGFSYCVPPEWRPRQTNGTGTATTAWESRDGSISWGTGRPQRTLPNFTATITGTIVVVSPGEPPPPAPPSSLPDASPCSEPTTVPYMIGTAVVVVSQVQCQGTWLTTGWSTSPAVYVQAETRGRPPAVQMLAVMQTIRIGPQSR